MPVELEFFIMVDYLLCVIMSRLEFTFFRLSLLYRSGTWSRGFTLRISRFALYIGSGD